MDSYQKFPIGHLPQIAPGDWLAQAMTNLLMVLRMGSPGWKQIEVFRSVIAFHLVDVMNRFSFTQGSSKNICGNLPVFANDAIRFGIRMTGRVGHHVFTWLLLSHKLLVAGARTISRVISFGPCYSHIIPAMRARLHHPAKECLANLLPATFGRWPQFHADLASVATFGGTVLAFGSLYPARRFLDGLLADCTVNNHALEFIGYPKECNV